MGKTTGIEWTDATWNPWYGCRKVSPACAHCYAERDMARYGRNFDVVTRAAAATFFAPMKWKEPRRIFTCSWSDFFIEEADDWRAEAFNVIRNTPQHTYLILTKRIARVAEAWNSLGPRLVTPMDENVWLGASVETTRQYHRIDHLRQVPARIRFLSMEPLLSATHSTDLSGIHWVIVGTESGPGARPTNLDWIRRIGDKCRNEGVAFFVKQLTTPQGTKIPFEEWPKDLQVREWPAVPNPGAGLVKNALQSTTA
jgi:protein gp37